MLPNLGGLSLHSPDATGGFYEVPPEEQATVNTDPITLEKPLHTMSFRVRLAENDSNGRPQYKYFSPFALWEWVKEHNTLPSREGPIWYEDWWALCNTYNPNQADVPYWAHTLERESQYRARIALEAQQREEEARREREMMARVAKRHEEVKERVRAAGRAQAARRERTRMERAAAGRASSEQPQSRAQRNAQEAFAILNPTAARREQQARGQATTRSRAPGYGQQSPTDHVLVWTFRVKGLIEGFGAVQDLMRINFRNYVVGEMYAFVSTTNWDERLHMSMDWEQAWPSDMGTVAAEAMKATSVRCTLYVPDELTVNAFRGMFTRLVERHGYADAMDVLFGIKSAMQVGELVSTFANSSMPLRTQASPWNMTWGVYQAWDAAQINRRRIDLHEEPEQNDGTQYHNFAQLQEEFFEQEEARRAGPSSAPMEEEDLAQIQRDFIAREQAMANPPSPGRMPRTRYELEQMTDEERDNLPPIYGDASGVHIPGGGTVPYDVWEGGPGYSSLPAGHEPQPPFQSLPAGDEPLVYQSLDAPHDYEPPAFQSLGASD